MALFAQYTRPGVYTSVVYEQGGLSLFGDARIPALVAEGQETKKLSARELHRGSSSVADEQKVFENLSDQVKGARTYKVVYAPVVKGDGKGVVTNDPSAIKAYTLNENGEDIPLRVTTLDGTTGTFMLQEILPLGSTLKVTYFFKRKDTLVQREDLTSQIPAFSSLLVQTGLTLGTTLPGFVGNNVKLALTQATAGNGVSDALAVSGAGTNLISVEIRKTDDTLRTVAELKALVDAGIPTRDAGVLVVSAYNAANAADALAVKASTFFAGGSGQNTNRTFKVANTPIVAGDDGGTVTNLPSKVTVLVNGNPVTVTAVDGLNGFITLAQGVPMGAQLLVTYYTNTYQDTYDELPAENVAEIRNVGFAPGSENFINGTDFVLVNNQIHWGACALTLDGKYTPGYTPFDATVITTTLVDEKMYLRPCEGAVDGVNVVYTLEDVPTDGSGHSRPTDKPELISVYVGTDPVQARDNGVVRVIRLNGKTRTFTLYNPPAAGQAVFASYYRNILNDHTFTLEVATPGITGQGTYRIKDELGNVLPKVAEGAHAVTEADFAVAGGIVWPFSFSDARAVAGQTPDETITLTFQEDNLTHILTPAVQATNLTAQTGLRFRATNTGTGPNGPGAGKPTVRMVSTTPCSDAAAVTIVDEAITININREDPGDAGQPHPTNPTRSLGDVATTVTSGNFTTALLGKLLCDVLNGTDPNTLCVAGAATNFSGGAAQVSQPYANRFKVSSSRTLAQANADGLGRTGGATTDASVPAFGSDTPGANGFLGQTFNDADTGFALTIVDPNEALDYGYTSLPSPSYYFRPGDKLVFNVSTSEVYHTSAKPVIALYGLRTKVVTTFGMQAGDSALIQTYNKAGNEPKIGEFYFVDLLLNKTDNDYALTFYTNLTDIYANYGDPVPENRASLAAKLMFQNGAGIVAIKQVKKETGLETASDQSYMEAISELAETLPGSDRKPDVIVPMSTSDVVLQYLAKHLNTQASPRMLGEAIGFVGLPIYATPADARNMARSLGSERVILAYPGGAILSVDINGMSTEFTVDGSFIAAAMCGLYLNPANDVATTLTTQKLVGFDRLIKRDSTTMKELMAADGVCVLEERNGALEILHYRTTSTDSILKQEPTTTTIVDYTRQRMRKALRQFIGRKGVQAVVTDVKITATSLLNVLVAQEILESHRDLVVRRDENDPTVLHVSVAIKPIFSILWISVQFRVTTKG